MKPKNTMLPKTCPLGKEGAVLAGAASGLLRSTISPRVKSPIIETKPIDMAIIVNTTAPRVFPRSKRTETPTSP